MSIEEFKEYMEMVSQYASGMSKEIIFNDNIAKAAVIHANILREANKRHLPIRMYCGEFSVYQDKTRSKIEDVLSSYEGYHSSDIDSPYDTLINNLNDYLENNGDMEVIIAKPVTGLSNQKLWDVVGKHIASKKLRFRILQEQFGLDHFTVSGTMYRREDSDAEKTAFCCFNSPKAELLKTAYEYLNRFSKETLVS